MISDANITNKGANHTHRLFARCGAITANPNRGSLLGGNGRSLLNTRAVNRNRSDFILGSQSGQNLPWVLSSFFPS